MEKELPKKPEITQFDMLFLNICQTRWPDKVEILRKAIEYKDKIYGSKDLYRKMTERIKEIERSIGRGNLEKCLLFHYLSSSTPGSSELNTFDLEENNSIFKLMETLVTEYGKSEQ